MNQAQILKALEDHPDALGVIPSYRAVRPHLDVQIYDCLESTNHHLWQLLDQGATAGTVVIARRQWAGRGQWGRRWQSPEGGLYLSLLLEVEVPVQEQGMLTLASAWGLATALVKVGLPIQIKWPNDLVVMGRKLGGILTEIRRENHQIRYAVIGVGLNWANPVPDSGITLKTLLEQTGGAGLETLESLAALTLRGCFAGPAVLAGSGLG
ncbi:Bifunctional ligase/repressor BirA [Halomicronema hongdechloris C2206]|uniref:Bifunctional ligase/repressor BirA n=1 Tax=Halomicronema hongdechloris C2206 TaxID=1641165 RepID=A0A1Z3HUS1_9CYAN|nr:biotin--[acetyl-CoA-carboxylase] ligase [Halomicronema hongdechloris]ASC74026.1 Bifunctional ligase/repressor BirA [Halomicronema hongdechloris C2206]